eukprot:TRINITY_DN733_c0_g1_i3.p1 TRINITY_DN733_c0_g1~~TRINITY_DN733_c0_g1_i3.p1  ORF type:complete len:440 (+),score=74.86 TRINITY_DN733_c0_g1_i3:55-1374(+)
MTVGLASWLVLLASASLAAGQGLLVKIPATGAEFTVYNIYHGSQHGLNVKMERLTILDAAGSVVTSHPLTGNNFIPQGEKIKVGDGYATRYSLTQTLAGGDIIFKVNMLIYTSDGKVTLPGYGTRHFKRTGDFSWDFAIENKGAPWAGAQVDTLLSGPTQPSQHDRSRATDAWFPEGEYNRNFWARFPKWYVADTRTHSMSSVNVAIGSQLWNQAQVKLKFGPVTRDLYYTSLLFGSLAYKRWCERSCFPGVATVDTLAGRVPLALLQAGDKVLVELAGGDRRYEEVLSFLHALPANEGASNAFYALEHLSGEFRASGNHVVFTADGKEVAVEEVRPGDQLRFEGAATTIVAVRESFGETGMYAPLTPAGSVVVDGVVASNYATVEGLEIPHSAMHASFFIARMFGQSIPLGQQEPGLHPVAALYKDVLNLDRMLKLVS